MMKTFQREVMKYRLLYGKGAARKHTGAHIKVTTSMINANNSERKNKMARDITTPD
jgi:hypothetical protein